MAELNKVLDSFLTNTPQSKVTVVIPLFGYWSDLKSEQLNKETLKAVLDRVNSDTHQVYILLLGEEKRIPDNIGNYVVSVSQAGNVRGISIPSGSTYADYIREGMDVALSETQSQFIIFINPWVMLQYHAIDKMVDRINYGDDVRIISGFDIREAIDSKNFDNYVNHTPKEEMDLTLDFMGMARFTAEVLDIDKNYKTHSFIARDMWQTMYSKGYDVITSQRIPIFPFDLDWGELELRENFEADKSYFINKWKFDPSITQ